MNIILYGDSSDKDLSDAILNSLTKYGDVQFFSKEKLINFKLSQNDNNTKNFFVYELDQLPRVINLDGLFIFKKSFASLSDKQNLSKQMLTIIEEHNLNAIKYLEKTNQTVITCGTSSKNTLSFSSISNSKAMVVLQRYLQTKNKIIEPHEFEVRLKRVKDPNIFLIICAIFLLSEISSLNGYEFWLNL